jgi:hypothetical protein
VGRGIFPAAGILPGVLGRETLPRRCGYPLRFFNTIRIAHHHPIATLHARGTGRRESLPAQATGYVSGTQNQTTEDLPPDPARNDRPGALLQLAGGPDRNSAGDFIKRHRTAFKPFWRWKSRNRGRPPLPRNIRDLIRRMSKQNPTWGEERIANELSLKLGIRVAPGTVGKYLRASRPRGTTGKLRWSTFVRSHAKAAVACDFFVSVTATFRVLYVFVAMEIGSRRILHTSATAHPTADWTIQQFREFLAFDHPYRFVIHDRDGIFSQRLDIELESFGIHVLKTPARTPTANVLRKTDWHDSPRVSRLSYPGQRAAPQVDRQRVRMPL